MTKRFFVAVFVSLLLLVCAGLPSHAADKPEGKIKAFVSLLPVAYFVARVGGPLVDVSVLVGPGQDPHSFEPTPRLMTKLAEARVLFKMGFPFEENIVKKIAPTFKNVEVVDLQQGIKLRPMTEEESEAEEAGHDHGKREEAEHDHDKREEAEHDHDKGKEEEHHHDAGEMDPHTWLDPRLAKIQAKTIADTLIRIDPSHKATYEENLKAFQADLDGVHDKLTKALAPVKGKSFFVFHPAWGYFGDAYGLKQVPVQIGGKEPTARQLAQLVGAAKKDGVKVIFVQPQFSKKTAETLAKSIGGAVVPLDDLSPDYLKNLQDMAKRINAALESQKQ